ncbi:hypothetical protein HK105_202396 [Polyrhizophydium stewartii]|uniref:Uncharacterized protein n=1 Tax=Polyrhizophydium stewartii TaxID=2732419 RepID=A0ABR4NER5_9FUNG
MAARVGSRAGDACEMPKRSDMTAGIPIIKRPLIASAEKKPQPAPHAAAAAAPQAQGRAGPSSAKTKSSVASSAMSRAQQLPMSLKSRSQSQIAPIRKTQMSVAESVREDVAGTIKGASPLSKNVHDKYVVSARYPKMAKSTDALKPHCSASYFLQITTTWDRGNRSVREKILREFVASNDKKTGPQLEKEFANGASLFLTRISAWLRLTYLLSYDLALQLRAITIFVSASSGNRFLSEFLEVGGVLTVLEILTLSQAKEGDKAEALRLLLTVANNGRKYKEFICESFGVRQVTECLSKSRSEITQDYARNLLAELGTGNPKFQMQVFKGLQSLLTSQAVSPTAQQMAGQALRILLPSIPSVPSSFIDPTMGLLRSPHIQVQYEGYEILRELLNRTPLQDPILLQLIAILRNIVDEGSDEVGDDRHRRNKMEQKGLVGQWGAISAEEQKEKDLITSGYVQQAYAAKLLGIMAATSHELAERMIQFQLVSSLLNVIANVGHPDSQRYAANTLLYLINNFDYVAYALRDHMGSNFFELLENKPDTFYRELTKEQVRYLRRNTFKIKKADSHPSITDSDSGSESSDDESGQKTGAHGSRSKKDAAAFPSTKDDAFASSIKDSKASEPTSTVDIEAKVHQQAILDTYEKKEEDVEEVPLVENLYTPFVQSTSKTTFASNKYVVGASPSEGAKKFTNELEKFRNTTLKTKKRDGKKEFDVTYTAEMGSRLTNIKNDPKLFSKEMAISGDMERKRMPVPRPKITEGDGAMEPRLSAVGNSMKGDGDDASGHEGDQLEMTPEEAAERERLLALAAQQQAISGADAAAEQAATSTDSGDRASFKSSGASVASDGDEEVMGEERDFSISVVSNLRASVAAAAVDTEHHHDGDAPHAPADALPADLADDAGQQPLAGHADQDGPLAASYAGRVSVSGRGDVRPTPASRRGSERE